MALAVLLRNFIHHRRWIATGVSIPPFTLILVLGLIFDRWT
jgi:hypothetical protein